jgi:hypothetical protein
MAPLAGGLMIVAIPKQAPIAAMRRDVIDDGRRGHKTLRLAFQFTQRMPREEAKAISLPSAVIAALARRGSLGLGPRALVPAMLRAKTRCDQSIASNFAAWPPWRRWHRPLV